MKILMVCLGNICRSPLAEGILANLIVQHKLHWLVESAGTGARYHEGSSPDPNSIAIAKQYKLDISHQRARQLSSQDLDTYDLIYALDSSNLDDILSLCKQKESKIKKIKLLMDELHPNQQISVPDPYGQGIYSFEKVFMMINEACHAIIKKYKNPLQ